MHIEVELWTFYQVKLRIVLISGERFDALKMHMNQDLSEGKKKNEYRWADPFHVIGIDLFAINDAIKSNRFSKICTACK